MQSISITHLLALTLALSGTLGLAGAAQAQDVAGSQPALTTLHKEIGAAYDEARRACAQGPANTRSACLQRARQTREDDLKAAPAQVAAARDMGGVTTTRTATVGDASTTTVETTPAAAAGR